MCNAENRQGLPRLDQEEKYSGNTAEPNSLTPCETDTVSRNSHSRLNQGKAICIQLQSRKMTKHTERKACVSDGTHLQPRERCAQPVESISKKGKAGAVCDQEGWPRTNQKPHREAWPEPESHSQGWECWHRRQTDGWQPCWLTQLEESVPFGSACLTGE